MSDEYEWEEVAEMGLMALQAFLDIEQQFVIGEHKLEEILDYWGNIFYHLEERIPQENKKALKANGKLFDEVEKLQKLLKEERHKDMSLFAEERKILEHVKSDFKHKAWRAVKYDEEKEERDEEKVLRLESKALRELHHHFIQALKHLKELEKALGPVMETQIEHWYAQLQNTFATYERILHDLWKKERFHVDKLKHH